jgi:hypothetical protein
VIGVLFNPSIHIPIVDLVLLCLGSDDYLAPESFLALVNELGKVRAYPVHL